MAELQKTKLALSNLCGEKHRNAETFLFLATLLCTPQDFIERKVKEQTLQDYIASAYGDRDDEEDQANEPRPSPRAAPRIRRLAGQLKRMSAYFETISDRVFRLASVILAASDAVEVGRAIEVAAKIVDLLEELEGLRHEETREYIYH